MAFGAFEKQKQRPCCNVLGHRQPPSARSISAVNGHDTDHELCCVRVVYARRNPVEGCSLFKLTILARNVVSSFYMTHRTVSLAPRGGPPRVDKLGQPQLQVSASPYYGVSAGARSKSNPNDDRGVITCFLVSHPKLCSGLPPDLPRISPRIDVSNFGLVSQIRS